jgi:Amt family ammonium transporter
VIVILGVDLLEYLRIDDPIGAVPVHGIAGIWGTISLGLFACGEYGASGPISPDNSAALKGLFYGGGTQVLVAQMIGSAVITLATFGVAMAVMLAVNATGTLRLPAEAELYGMDLHEHGISAYPEYEISPFASPTGLIDQISAAEKANTYSTPRAMARTGMDKVPPTPSRSSI